MPSTILVFAPHPDDEGIACGGSIVQHIKCGDAVYIIYATDGRHSHSAVLDLYENPSPEELVDVRQNEAIRCAGVLGVSHENLHFLGIEDTQMPNSQDQYLSAVESILKKIPSIDRAYLPHEELDSNIDHRYTGQLAVEVLNRLSPDTDIYRYVVWDVDNLVDQYTSNSEILVEVDIAQERSLKAQAFSEHKSQVTYFGSGQTRPVLLESFSEPVFQAKVERFWVSQQKAAS
jgi:LmbE family N-acetylglucosaminyl deacetylase